MKDLNDDTMEEFTLPNTSFGFSATSIDELGENAFEYTIVDIVVDESGSVHDFKDGMEGVIKETIKACRLSPRSDNLLIRVVTFNDKMREIHGYKLLEKCNVDDYDGVLDPYGRTALYCVSENTVLAATKYAKSLTDSDFSVNNIVFIITDGDDNVPTATAKSVKVALEEAARSESTESFVSVLIGVGVKRYPPVARFLEKFHQEAGIDKYMETEDVSPSSLAKVAEFVSKSVSAQSQSLNGGAGSTPTSLSI